MDKKTQQKEMKTLAMQLLESRGIVYEEWLMDRHYEVVSEYSKDILTALKLVNEKD